MRTMPGCPMPTVLKLIEQFGGWEVLKNHPIRIQPESYMRLVIEFVGTGPRGFRLISVAHYYEQEGDLMRDPEITFEVDQNRFYPVTYTQDNLGIYQEAVFVEPGPNGPRVMMRVQQVADIASFARIWDKNLKEQGYLNEPSLPQSWVPAKEGPWAYA